MKQESNPLTFFGTENFSATVLKNLLDAGIEIEAIITKPDTKKDRGHKLQPPKVKEVGISYNIPVYQPQDIKQMEQIILKKTSRHGGLLVSFGKIIPEGIIQIFKFGIINLHPSLLPKYRGPSPIESAILNGDEKTGASIIALNAKMDAGDIIAQQTIAITKTTDAKMLYQELATVGSELLIKTLPTFFNNQITLLPQIDQEATYCQLLTKKRSWLNPKQHTASELERQIRAFTLFPRSRYIFFNHDCIVTKAEVINAASADFDSLLTIACKNKSVLNVLETITPTGKKVSATDFINGYKK